jgi:hypothetical protein
MKILLPLCASFLGLIGNAQTNISGIFSTGVDNSGNLLSVGESDPHWTISSSPVGTVLALAASREHDWVANTASSQWINATGVGEDSEPAGLYIYTLTFSLNGLEPSTAQITGEWASDNESEIYLNGTDTGYSNPTDEFGALDPFSITNDFVAGVNELQFYVTQNPGGGTNPEGLQVDIFSASAEPVPEPATLSLFAISALGIYLRKQI